MGNIHKKPVKLPRLEPKVAKPNAKVILLGQGMYSSKFMQKDGDVIHIREQVVMRLSRSFVGRSGRSTIARQLQRKFGKKEDHIDHGKILGFGGR